MNQKSLILIFYAVLLSSVLFAQTGSIQGTVLDSENRPLPGVTFQASSPMLIGRIATTDSDRDGFYRFPALPPGEYEIQTSIPGFQSAVQKNIRVFADRTLNVDFRLELSKVSEIIEVTEEPPLIDISTTAVSFVVPPEIVSNLPRVQNISELLSLTPGVGDDRIAYGGDGNKANSLLVDGVNVSSPRNGNLDLQYNQNWIESIQVSAVGAPAEYGGFTGVAGNFTLRSGGDVYHGLFETFFQNKNLVSTNTPDAGDETPFTSYDFNAQIGGPILENKLWFFSGFQYPHTETNPFGFDGITRDIYKKFITKLTYKFDENNLLQGFAHWNDQFEDGIYASASVLPEATATSKNTEWSWNSSWTSLLTSDTIFEGKFSGFHTYSHDLEDQPNLPGHNDLGTGLSSINAGSRFRNNHSRYQANAAASHHARDFVHGKHDFRFGLEFERSYARDEMRPNGGMYYLDYFGAPYARYIQTGYLFDGSNHRWSAYVQDDWNVTERLNLSVGVRWDHNRGSTDRGLVFKTDPVAPRIGFVYLLNKEHQTAIKVHYGDYYEALVERDYYFLTENGRTDIFQIYNGTEWEEISRFHEIYVGNDHLRHPRVRQFTAGLDSVMPGNIPFGVHYIHRRFGNILEDVGIDATYEPFPYYDPLTGETLILYNRLEEDVRFQITNPPALYRHYNGLEFFASKQFKNLTISGSFVYSRQRGTYPGDYNFVGVNTPFLDTPNSLIYFPGKLDNDPSIAWKIVGTYAFPHGFSAGWYLRHETGDRWTPRIFPPGLNPRGYWIWGEPYGSRRLSSQTPLDLRLEKAFPFYKGQFRLTADLFNALNSTYATGVGRRYGADNFGKPLLFNEPRRIRLGARFSF